jgi:hypothetical protein
MNNTIEAQTSAEQILALERAALDRWGKGDPGGFLELYANDITYFVFLRQSGMAHIVFSPAP